MRLLVLGGTRYLGRHVVELGLARGFDVTLFHRGRSARGLFPAARELLGERDGDLQLLSGSTWDAVIDTSGYFPRLVRASAERLADAVGHYCFVSSLSVYADFSQPGLDESAAPAELDDPDVEDSNPAFYGGLKALCERAVEAALPGRSSSVRSGLIAGPHDTTDRFPYWVRRLARGGRILVPGSPADAVQLIDARDLAAFVLQLAETRTAGVFNATCPPIGMGELLTRCASAVDASHELVWVDSEFLLEHGVVPYTGLPLWVPGPEYAGFNRVDVSRALAAGLAPRPIEDTARAVHAFELARAPRESSPALTPEAERDLLAKYGA